ncbi:hypothetical protein SmJEL517_g01439 [Synchytrium microbalum]|uniref:Signal recognition particle subunit SRP68 n=1 Tax=Synchytrium microbalum TaxID=1806994 RepID=A0A507C9Z6_9FUNG|nr:uncharacterized protein SmJEL517_g01439 [Synchytrium microbalum]TPX36168.1 hypothetical protein SmJEL517_g01439 [Synchytrium microbalum]
MEDTPAPLEPLSIDILAVTKNAQDSHGLRHQDYQRYRQYCARKIHRVRKVVGLTQGKKKYEKRELPAETAVLGHLEILLFQAERAWSYAMQLKGEVAQEPRRKHHARARLQRAAAYASELETVCQTRGVDSRTLLDAQAYAALMKGYVLFEEQKWQEALDKFAAARTIYEKLSTVGSAEQEALCQSAVDAIDPSIRFCAYNRKIKGGASADISVLLEMRNKTAGGSAGLDLLTRQIEDTLAQTRHKKAVEVSSITWRGKTVPSKNEKLIEAILAAQESLQQLDKAIKDAALPLDSAEALDERLREFDAVIGALWDASRIAEQDVKDDAVAVAKVKTSKSDANTFNLHYISSYVAYLRLSKTVERNLLLIEATKHKFSGQQTKMPDQLKSARLEDVPKLYNAIVNTLKETSSLPGVEADVPLQRILGAKMSLYHAFKMYHIGALLTSARRRNEAFAVMDKASEYLVSARAELDSVKKSTKKNDLLPEDTATLSTLDTDMSSLDTIIRGSKIRERARAVMEATSTETAAAATNSTEPDGEKSGIRRKPLIDNLDTFMPSFDPSDPNLVELPPTFQPIPCKPLFFDVAYNSIEYPLNNLARRAKGLPRLAKGEKEVVKKAVAHLAHHHLEGSQYVRTGPNSQPQLTTTTGIAHHWFDGDGHLHGVYFDEHLTPHYVNKYVKTGQHLAEKALNARVMPRLGELTSEKPLVLVKALIKSRLTREVIEEPATRTTANTALVYHDGRLMSLMEANVPYEVVAPSLDSIGPFTFSGEFAKHPAKAQFTAHPKVDPFTKELFCFGYRFEKPSFHYSVVNADGTLKICQHPVECRTVMMHDFAITEHYAIILDLPFTFNGPRVFREGKSALMFDSRLPSRFGIMDRYNPKKIKWFDDAPCYVYHTANAYEDGQEVVLVGCRSEKAADLNTEGFTPKNVNIDDYQTYLTEWRFDMVTGKVCRRMLGNIKVPVEFPRIRDSELLGRKMRYVYTGRLIPGALIPVMDAIVKFDLETGIVEAYELGQDAYGGEPVFVPIEGAEDSGYLVGFVYNETHGHNPRKDTGTTNGKSSLIIVNASTMKLEARIDIPFRVPYGFHGIWISKDDIKNQRPNPHAASGSNLMNWVTFTMIPVAPYVIFSVAQSCKVQAIILNYLLSLLYVVTMFISFDLWCAICGRFKSSERTRYPYYLAISLVSAAIPTAIYGGMADANFGYYPVTLFCLVVYPANAWAAPVVYLLGCSFIGIVLAAHASYELFRHRGSVGTSTTHLPRATSNGNMKDATGTTNGAQPAVKQSNSGPRIPLSLCMRIVAWTVLFAINAALTAAPACLAMLNGGFSASSAGSNTSVWVSAVSGIVLFLIFGTSANAFEQSNIFWIYSKITGAQKSSDVNKGLNRGISSSQVLSSREGV